MIISNTEVTAKNLCDVKHDFRFIRSLEPKRLSPALYKGVIGHDAFRAYYEETREGSSTDTCVLAFKDVVQKEIRHVQQTTPQEFEQINDLMFLFNMIDGYAHYYNQEDFKVILVEQDLYTNIGPDLDYGMRLDLLVEMTRGKYRGDLVVVDHKFVYNFKTQLEIDMDGQLPKYIKTARDNGYVVTKGMFNQIRTRRLKSPGPTDLYRREFPVKTTREETARIWKEQEYTARKIARERTDPDYMPVRTLSLLVCRSCEFKDPCKASLNGDDVSTMLTANYQPSKYGYHAEIGEA